MTAHRYALNRRPFPFLVGLVAPAGTGKSTTAAALEDHLPTPVVRLSCADPIRAIAQTIARCPLDSLTDPTRKEQALGDASLPLLSRRTARELLVLIGEQLRDAIHESLWVEHLLQRAADEDPSTVILVDDIRRPAEAHFCDLIISLRRGDIVWRGGATESGDAIRPDLHLCLDGLTPDAAARTIAAFIAPHYEQHLAANAAAPSRPTTAYPTADWPASRGTTHSGLMQMHDQAEQEGEA